MERNDTQHTGIALLDALDREVGRFSTMVASADPARPVPRSTWTVGDTVAHLATGINAYAAYLGGDASPVIDLSDVAGGSIATSNADRLAADGERDIPTLLALLDTGYAEVRRAAMAMDLDDEVSWHGRAVPLRDDAGHRPRRGPHARPRPRRRPRPSVAARPSRRRRG